MTTKISTKGIKEALLCVICHSKLKRTQQSSQEPSKNTETVCSKCWEEFNKNWDFLGLLSKVEEEKYSCVQCHKEKQEIFCLKCRAKFCLKCIEQDHSSCITVEIKGIINLIEEKAALLKEKINDLERIQVEKEESLDILEIKESRILDEVEREFKKYREELENNKSALKEEITNYFQKIREKNKSENQWKDDTLTVLEEIEKKELKKKESYLTSLCEQEGKWEEFKVDEWKESEKAKINNIENVLNNAFVKFDNNLMEFLQKRSLAHIFFDGVRIPSKKEKLERSINGSLPELSTSKLLFLYALK